MSDDRRGEVSGPILTFDISATRRQGTDRGAWRALVHQFAQAAMAVQDLPSDASDLERLQVTFWALKSAEGLHHQVRADAESRLKVRAEPEPVLEVSADPESCQQSPAA